ncbi:sedoheptulose-bisphosphatase [Geosmithia morbida]|uniref:Sedoheptulose-bisphosphatase n=1 Tax=Geosmithia morbida TaxID=1094350 RepID=A0A9P4YVN0_9HYPO|nr:sedoheptulose-bisphosphatase [Geosmithia morbida]KAF4121844.1 sedoheptulose-bisphosphatase [Geosmithia morbida]
MADKFQGSPSLRALLQSAVPQSSRTALRSSVLPALLTAVSDIAAALRTSGPVAAEGTSNDFGDEQLNVDLSAERAMRTALARCPSVATASSEEDPVETSVNPDGAEHDGDATGERYTVAFDPLDGSSIIGPNWSVGAIVGVWDGTSALGRDPRTGQVAAVLGVFGPRTTAVVAVRVPGSPSDALCLELGLDRAGRWDVVRDRVRLQLSPPYRTRYFAPANLRAAADDPGYMSLVTRSVGERYTLRYSGGLVPDLVHALVKGHGLYVSPVTPASPPKLRRLYELCPVALIVECAGGAAVDPALGRPVLDAPLAHTDERGGLVCGNRDEVDRALRILASDTA